MPLSVMLVQVLVSDYQRPVTGRSTTGAFAICEYFRCKTRLCFFWSRTIVVDTSLLEMGDHTSPSNTLVQHMWPNVDQ